MNYLDNSLLVLGLVGITIIITSSSILNSLRIQIKKRSDTLGELIECPMCTGFWVGLFFGAVSGIAPPIIMGGLISLLSWSTYTVVDYFATKSTWYAVLISSKTQTIEQGTEISEDDIEGQQGE